ncbi:MAG: hypothetical protein AAFP90_05095 [Planctomycetota bacterium]
MNAITSEVATDNALKAAVLRLLDRFQNLDAFVATTEQSLGVELSRYGIDEAPLWNLTANRAQVTARAKEVFGRSREPLLRACKKLLTLLQLVKEKNLLGANTAGKLAFLKDCSGDSYQNLSQESLEANALLLRRRTHELLQKQLGRLGLAHKKTKEVVAAIDLATAAFSSNDLLFHRLNDFCERSFPQEMVTFSEFVDVYCDLICQLVDEAEREANFASKLDAGNQGLTIGYSPRDLRFTRLGDIYGDCTARDSMPGGFCNIHDSVYTWILDPHYRILEVKYKGAEALKAHVLPLIVNGSMCLMIDAIEVVPQLRPTIRGKRNPFISESMWLIGSEMIDLLLQTTIHIAQKMNVSTVLAEPFSNADWIRMAIERERHPLFVPVEEIEKPFAFSAIEHVLRSEGLDEVVMAGFPFEIQAKNCSLMDTGTRPGIKELLVVAGPQPTSGFRVISGP